MESRFVGRVILGSLSLLGWGLFLMPWRVRVLLGNALGHLLTRLGLRSEVVARNLAYAYPGQVERQEELYRKAYAHLGQLILEVPLIFGPFRRFIRRSTEVTGLENWRNASLGGRGTVFLSSHVGNWEIMAGSSSLVPGMRLMLVTKHLRPEWLHQGICRARLRYGVSGAYEPRTLRDVLAHLKSGGTVGIVLDQYAGPPVGLRVPVFGIPVSTPSLVAMLARRTGAAVLPVVNYRLPGGRYRIKISPPVGWIAADDPGEELGVNTMNYSKIIENEILSHPEQWLWIHRRFKGDLSPLREGEWREGRARS